MKRTTVMLPDDVLAQLRHESRRRGSSVAEIVREAIERHMQAPGAGGSLSFFAVGEGGPGDASERVDEYVVDAVRERFRRREEC
ncbi:MAG: CopG family transcriptional regulator [Solirubrobacteraceae bacterium]